jgi:hypothetical protein
MLEAKKPDGFQACSKHAQNRRKLRIRKKLHPPSRHLKKSVDQAEKNLISQLSALVPADEHDACKCKAC